MAIETGTEDRVLGKLLKEPFAIHIATSMAKSLNVTRQGIWKALNRLAENELIYLEHVGDAKTSTATIKLNWSNPVTEKTLSLMLAKESVRQQRWRVNFAEMGGNAEFLVLFGSILNNPKEANDVDILAVVSKKKFREVEEAAIKVQQTQLKKIHLVALTKTEFRKELKKPNKVYLDAVKKGIILYGQDSFIRFVKEM